MRTLLLISLWALKNQLLLGLRWLWHPLRVWVGVVVAAAIVMAIAAVREFPVLGAYSWWARPVALGATTVALFQVTLNLWLFSKDLSFLPGEVAFVFPAPVSRAALLGARLVFVQPALLLAAVIVAVFVPALPEDRPRLVLGVHVAFSFLHLNALAASLARVPDAASGRASWLRPLVVGGLALGLAGLAWSFRAVELGIGAQQVLALLDGDDLAFRKASEAVGLWAAEGPQALALAPFRALAELVAPGGAPTAALLPPALLVLLPPLLYILLGRSHFLEEALQSTAARQLRLERARAGHWLGLAEGALPPPTVPLELAPGPTWAVAWSHLAGLSRVRPARHALDAGLLALLAVATARLEVLAPYRETTLVILQVGAAGVVFFAPDASTLDLRAALKRPAWLRTLPVPGWRVVLALAAPNVLQPWALASLLLGLAAIVAGGLPEAPRGALLLSGLLGAIAALLPVVACGTLITNAAGLVWRHCAVFPPVALADALGWYLVIFLRIVGGGLLAAPATLVGALWAGAGLAVLGPVALLLGGLVFAAILGGTLAPLVLLAGRRLDAYEPPAS